MQGITIRAGGGAPSGPPSARLTPRARGSTLRAAALCAAGLGAANSIAQDPAPGPTLHHETGLVTVQGGVATIDLPDGWIYLQQQEARYVVERQWGNSAKASTLGLILPSGQHAWGGIIVSYALSGHVMGDPQAIDAELLFAELLEDVAANNRLRQRGGQPEIELLGWAEPPHYDPIAKKLRWGKRLRVGGSGNPIVNYEMRVLGANGALVMQAVVDESEFGAVRAGMQQVLDATDLGPGLRYADFDPTLHRVSRSSLEGLIVGGRAASSPRVSLFRVVLKPLIAIVVVAIAFWASARRRRLVPGSA
jgi:uncharacterized membrane-anchored protein